MKYFCTFTLLKLSSIYYVSWVGEGKYNSYRDCNYPFKPKTYDIL